MSKEMKLQELQEEYRRKDERGIPMSIRERYLERLEKLKEEVRDRKHYKRLGQILVEENDMTKNQLRRALEKQAEAREDKLLGEVMIEEGYLDLEKLERAIRKQLELEKAKEEQVI